MKCRFSAHIIIAVAALASYSLFANLSLFALVANSAHAIPKRGGDPISKFEDRYTELKKHLPARGVVGYIMDGPPEMVLTDNSAQAEYFVTQYTVTPVILQNNHDEALVIGNFHNTASLKKALSSANLKVVKDFGGGLILFERRAPR